MSYVVEVGMKVDKYLKNNGNKYTIIT